MEHDSNKPEVFKKNKMKLWKNDGVFSNYEMSEEDCRLVSEQFFKKCSAIKENKYYKPDPTKNILFKKEFKPMPFDFLDFCNNSECVESLKCENLRLQELFFIEYTRNELIIIKDLEMKYKTLNPEEKEAICILQLVKLKKANLGHIDSIMEDIRDIILNSQKAADHFDNMYKIVRNKK